MLLQNQEQLQIQFWLIMLSIVILVYFFIHLIMLSLSLGLRTTANSFPSIIGELCIFSFVLGPLAAFLIAVFHPSLLQPALNINILI